MQNFKDMNSFRSAVDTGQPNRAMGAKSKYVSQKPVKILTYRQTFPLMLYALKAVGPGTRTDCCSPYNSEDKTKLYWIREEPRSPSKKKSSRISNV
jgi:hypothetical protein